MQYSTQHYGRRPYGVGMLIAGCDVSNFTLNYCYHSLCCLVESRYSPLPNVSIIQLL